MTSVPPADLMPPDDTPFGSGRPGDDGAGRIRPGDQEADQARPAGAAPPGHPALPDGGIGQRRARRLHRLQERRRRRLRLASAGTAVLAVAAASVTLATSGHLRLSPARHARSSAVAGGSPALPPALLVQADDAGRAVSIIVLAPASGNRGGSLVLVPPGTMTEIPSLGLEPVGLALQVGGPDRLKSTVENLFGVTLGSVTVVNNDQLAALVRPAGPLQVMIPERVAQVAADGSVMALFDQGPALVAPEQVPTLLAARGQETDLGRLARQQAFFDAWLARIHDDPGADAGVDPGLRADLDALAKGTLEPRVLPVEQVGRADDGTEEYRVQEPDLAAMVAAAFPGQVRGTALRPQVQILNGTGALELDSKVADRLLPAGVEVRLTGNANSFDYSETQIIFYDPAKQAVAERVQRALGVGKLVLSRRALDVVDLTVIVGKDFRTG